MELQVKSKLRAARARLAALHKLQPQHRPTNVPIDQPQSEIPSQHMQPAQLRALQPSDLRDSSDRPQQPGHCKTDGNELNTPANAHGGEHPAVVRNEDAQEDFDLCVICIEVAPQVRFQPCSHVVACEACASKVLLRCGECPMCRYQLAALELLPL